MYKLHSKGNKFLRCLMILLIVLMTMTSISAATGSGSAPVGTGDGSGGGKNIPFALVETKPSDGAENVSVNTTIWLLFNKNAVNRTIKLNNKANIILRDSDGDEINAEVTMKDEQVEPEFKREIVVVPDEPLTPGTSYTLTVGKGVKAKNGQTLGKDYTVTFTTAEQSKTDIQQKGDTKTTVSQASTNSGNTSAAGQSSKDIKATGTKPADKQASANTTNSGVTVTSNAITANGIQINEQSQADKPATDSSAKAQVTEGAANNSSKSKGFNSGLIVVILLLIGSITAIWLLKNRRKK